MISRVEGELLGVTEGGAEVRCGDLTYTLLVPTADRDRLAGEVGRRARFYALHYVEATGKGTTLIPRLIGFASPDERAFFELLTTVKGLGTRKALKALHVSYRSIAEAIAGKDADMLTTLPEVGRRLADTIVAELHGKVDRFIEPKPEAPPAAGGRGVMIREALAALIKVGESKAAAQVLIDRALSGDPELDSADALVAAAYRVRSEGVTE